MTKKTSPKKTDALTLRLSPKVKYLIELCSRNDRTTITGVIEGAVHLLSAQRRVSAKDREMSLGAAAEFCWSPDECERIVNLMLFLPQLMTHEESCIHAVIWDAGEIFLNQYPVNGQQDYDYRSHWVDQRRGVFLLDEDGNTFFATPRRKTIKLAWGLICERASLLAETGKNAPLTAAEVEKYIGKPLSAIKPTIKAPDDGLDDLAYQDDGLDDVVDQLTKG